MNTSLLNRVACACMVTALPHLRGGGGGGTNHTLEPIVPDIHPRPTRSRSGVQLGHNTRASMGHLVRR